MQVIDNRVYLQLTVCSLQSELLQEREKINYFVQSKNKSKEGMKNKRRTQKKPRLFFMSIRMQNA